MNTFSIQIEIFNDDLQDAESVALAMRQVADFVEGGWVRSSIYNTDDVRAGTATTTRQRASHEYQYDVSV